MWRPPCTFLLPNLSVDQLDFCLDSLDIIQGSCTHALLPGDPQLPYEHVLCTISILRWTSEEALRGQYSASSRATRQESEGSVAAEIDRDSQMGGPSSIAFAPPLDVLLPMRTEN